MLSAKELSDFKNLAEKLSSPAIYEQGRLTAPAPIDDEIADLTQRFASADERDRLRVIELFPERSWLTFLAFARRMAELAIRESNEARLRQGLLAIAIEDCRFDWRDDIVVLNALYASAKAIGADWSSILEEMARLANAETADLMRSYVKLPINRGPGKSSFRSGHKSRRKSRKV